MAFLYKMLRKNGMQILQLKQQIPKRIHSSSVTLFRYIGKIPINNFLGPFDEILDPPVLPDKKDLLTYAK